MYTHTHIFIYICWSQVAFSLKAYIATIDHKGLNNETSMSKIDCKIRLKVSDIKKGSIFTLVMITNLDHDILIPMVRIR